MAERDDREQPRWLTAEEREVWLSVVWVAGRLPAVLDAQLERDADLNFFEYTVLARTSSSAWSGAVTCAARPTRDDGRCTQAVLTDAGMAKVVATAPGHVEAARRYVIDAVSPTQLRQLRAANDRILRRTAPEATTRPLAVDAGGRSG